MLACMKEPIKIDNIRNTVVSNAERTENFLIIVNHGENGFLSSCEK